MGKGKDPSKEEGAQHVSRPLATLKDPAAFGPPPRNVNYHGGAALPNQITPETGGWGAPLTQDQINSANRVATKPEEEVVEEQRPAGPPLPYRSDRTGLKTDHLPPPPVHRDINRGPSVAEAPAQPQKPKPGLPPRLPSRQNTATSITPPPVVASAPPQAAPPTYEQTPTHRPSPPPSSNYGINQAAVNRLGSAGVSVPGLGIGSNTASNPWENEHGQSNTVKTPSPQPQPPANQLSELQSRFARMATNANGNHQAPTPSYATPAQAQLPAATPLQPALSPPQQQPQPQGTTWAEKQAALRTTQNVQQSPSTVTLSEAQTAAKTANAFRERHQGTINTAGQKANDWNKKYNVTGRLNSFLEKHNSPTSETPPPVNHNGGGVATSPTQMPQTYAPQPQSPEVAASISRKPPPPPPPKKPANMQASTNSLPGTTAPPPVPLGTKPGYT